MAKIPPIMTEPRVFTGVMDKDSDVRAVQNGDYIDLLSGFNGITTNLGTVTNVPGNTELLFTLPQGINKCIGAYEDLQHDTVIFLNYNSGGFHGIYRWFQHKQGLPNGRIEKVLVITDPTAYDPYRPNPLGFSNKAEHRVTGMFLIDDYFYFTDDFGRPKMVDIVRGNVTDKRRIFNIYFNRATNGLIFGAPPSGAQYTVTLYQAGNPSPLNEFSYIASANNDPFDYEHQTENFILGYRNATAYGGDPTNVPSKWYDVDDCNDYPIVTMNYSGDKYLVIKAEDPSTGTVYQAPTIVPVNFYPDGDKNGTTYYEPLSRDLIDRLCYTPQCNPTVSYQTDLDFKANYVSNKVFQFLVRYIYFDHSQSVTSARSIVPLAASTCDVTIYNKTNNYILIDFTDERLSNPSKASIIQRVEIMAKQPAVDGSQWSLIAKLEPYECVGPDMQQYKFYNNKITESVDQTETEQPYSALPIIAQSDELVDDRSFMGGLLEGYDPPCIEADINITYNEPQELIRKWTVSGVGTIWSNYYPADTTKYFLHQVIVKYGNSYYFGGIGKDGSSPLFGDWQIYLQEIPLAGFVVYLAGTPFYGIARHPNNIANMFPGVVIPKQEVSTGAFILDNTGATENAFFNMLDYADAQQFSIPLNYSIPNVPEGRYVVRVGGWTLTDSDLTDDNDLSWQRTSSWMYFYPPPETQFEVTINVTSDTTVPQDFIIRDSVDTEEEAAVMWAYNVGADSGSTPTSIDEFLGETKIEQASVHFLDVLGGTDEIQITDHNGFIGFYVKGNNNGTGVNAITSGTQYSNVQTTSLDFYGGGLLTAATFGTAKLGAVQWGDALIASDQRTVIQGEILDGNGNPVAGVSVVNTRGAWTKSGPDGTWALYSYATNNTDNRTDEIIYTQNNPICALSFPNHNPTPWDNYNYNITISANALFNQPPPYNVNNPLVLSTVANLGAQNTIQSVFNRGGDYDFYIEYLDEGDRLCRAAYIGSAHILWLTEPDDNGMIQPAGPPSITITIHNPPPDYAVKYHILVSKNQQMSGQLMWIANEVDYLDYADDTVVTVANAKKCKIDLQNIGMYVSENPGSIIDYTFQKGDRIRFINLGYGFANLTYYLEYEVLEVGSDYIIIPVDAVNQVHPGALFQIYHPVNEAQTKLVYEFGQCHDVESVIQNGILRKVHKGDIQNQVFGPSPAMVITPAIVSINAGEVYYRQSYLPWNYDPTVSPVQLPLHATINVFSDSISDFYVSRFNGYGRANTDSKQIAQLVRGSTVRFSDRYIAGTLQNGLRNFQPGNEKQFSTIYGKIMKLTLVNKTVLKAFFSKSFTVSMYINQGILRSITNAGVDELLALSDDVIPKTHDMQRNFGTLNAESVVTNDEGETYGWDENYGVVWMIEGDGMKAVSDEKMISEFNRVHDARNSLGRNNSEVVAVYDKKTKTYIISFLPMAPKDEVKAHANIVLPDFGLQSTQCDYYRAADFLIFTPSTKWLGITINGNFYPIGTGGVELTDVAVINGFLASLNKGTITWSATIGGPAQPVIQTVLSSMNNTNIIDSYSYSFNGSEFNTPVTQSGCAPVITDRITLTLKIPQLNLTLFTVVILDPPIGYQDPDYPDASAIIIREVNAGTPTHGFVAILDEYGNVNLYAPGGGIRGPYNNLSAVATITAYPPAAEAQAKDYSFLFINGSSAADGEPYPGNTYVYCRGKNGWIQRYPYIPECFGYLRDDLLSFQNGVPWLHNNPVYNNFFGAQYDRTMTVPFNEKWQKVRTYTYLEINCLRPPFCPNITVPATDQNSVGMNTELTKPHFRQVLGKFWSKLTRDKLTPWKQANPDDAWANGREMRGQAIIVEISDDSAELSPMIESQMGYFYSERT